MFLINGQSSESLNIRDRGLHYGDGLFETIAVRNRYPLCWRAHLDRLQSGCERLGIDCPDLDLLLREAESLLTAPETVVLKIIVTRGTGGRGYKLPERSQPTRILAVYPWPDYPPENTTAGITVRFCETRLAKNPRLAGMKHLNRLEQVLARSEWDDPDIAEGLMMDTDDNIIEGCMSNVFVLQGNTLLTPDLTFCGINGIVRQEILRIAPAMGLETAVTSMKYRDLLAADGMFLCNSTFGLWPVARLADTRINLPPLAEQLRQRLIEQDCIVG